MENGDLRSIIASAPYVRSSFWPVIGPVWSRSPAFGSVSQVVLYGTANRTPAPPSAISARAIIQMG